MSAKWDALCAKYKHFRHVTSDAYFRAGQLAAQLRQSIIDGCECDQDYVLHYRYEEASHPDFDQSEKAESPWQSVVKTDDGWTIGFGIQLEIAPNTYPK